MRAALGLAPSNGPGRAFVSQEEQAAWNLEYWQNLFGGGASIGTNSQTSGGSKSGRKKNSSDEKKSYDKKSGTKGTKKPIILDLDGDGLQIIELSQSNVFLDANNDGLENRIAWAAAGNGVLFYDANGDDEISETREFVFTEWDPTAASDLEAIASIFEYINGFYNPRRRHSALGWKSPVAFERKVA